MDTKLEVVVLPVADVDRANRVTGPATDHQSYGSFISFSDPAGNTSFVQEIATRLPGR